MKAMTDNENKKDLESYKTSNCDECPFYGVKEDCEVELPEEALNLINRQKAEIERLRAERDKEHQYTMHYARMCAKAKSEAIKEFAERFEKKIKDVKFTIGQTWEIKCALKQTLKEMTEQ